MFMDKWGKERAFNSHKSHKSHDMICIIIKFLESHSESMCGDVDFISKCLLRRDKHVVMLCFVFRVGKEQTKRKKKKRKKRKKTK